jgi:hypothetical protein
MKCSSFIFLLLVSSYCIGQAKTSKLNNSNPIFIRQINKYIDSVNHLENLDSVFKQCAGVNLLYFTKDGRTIKIIESSSGYRYLDSKQIYYFRSDSIISIIGDMEIYPQDEKYAILELQKIYFQNYKICYYLLSTQKYYPDKLFKNDNDIEVKSNQLRVRAKFVRKPIEKGVEENIYKQIPIYKKALTVPNNDPFLEAIYSPFI